MLAAVETIPFTRHAVLPALLAAVVWLLLRWSVQPRSSTSALGRMILQLLLLRYVLSALFRTQSPAVALLVLSVMVAAAAWIAIRTAPARSWRYYRRALVAIASGGGVTLVTVTVTQRVLAIAPWFNPEKAPPLGRRIFASSMTAVSLAAERFASEEDRGAGYAEARGAAMRSALIPITNSLLAVGLVQTPGFMTGQILNGADPLIAARYQVMVMAMVFSSAGLSAAVYLVLSRPSGPSGSA